MNVKVFKYANPGWEDFGVLSLENACKILEIPDYANVAWDLVAEMYPLHPHKPPLLCQHVCEFIPDIGKVLRFPPRLYQCEQEYNYHVRAEWRLGYIWKDDVGVWLPFEITGYISEFKELRYSK